jgi:hypothetical protein
MLVEGAQSASMRLLIRRKSHTRRREAWAIEPDKRVGNILLIENERIPLLTLPDF